MSYKYPLIHVGIIKITQPHSWRFLRKVEPSKYVWFEENPKSEEIETPIAAQSVTEAIRLASAQWKEAYFQLLNCGFRYTLPERDEHGLNALFCQMVASYSSSNGVYFEEDLGHLCYVQNASIEAQKLWKHLKQAEKL